MNFNLINNIQSCYVDIPQLLYYSHIPAVVISLLVGFFVFLNAKNLVSKILLFISIIFSFWVAINLFLWMGHDGREMVFLWSLFGILNPLLFASCAYFTHVYLGKKDVGIRIKLIWVILLLPSVLFISKNTTGFNIATCEASEGGWYFYYFFCLELLFFAWVLVFAVYKYFHSEQATKKQLVYFTAGIELFMFSFFLTGFLASYLAEKGYGHSFELEQYGLFGMIFFMGVLAYMIVRFKAFNIKLLAAQALVVGIIILVASQFAFIQNNTNRILTGITLAIVSAFGWWLVKSVKIVDEQREQLEIANVELEKLDKAKNEFINIASHQLRTPITVIKGVISMLQDGTMDKFDEPTKKKFFEGANIKCKKLETIINDILNATSLSNNRYNVMDKGLEKIDVNDFFTTMIDGFKSEVVQRDMTLELGEMDATVPEIYGQKQYLEEAFSNLINNAIKYTPSPKKTDEIKSDRQGEAKITISNKRDGEFVIFSVKDNGIGIPADAIPTLFKKFVRAKNAMDMYIDGTGLGLFVIKEIVEGHGGQVWVESEIGKGSEFFVKLPIHPGGQVNIKEYIRERAETKM